MARSAATAPIGAMNTLMSMRTGVPAIGVVVLILAGCGERETVLDDPSVWDSQVTTASGEVMNVDVPKKWPGDEPPGGPVPEGTELWLASTDGDWQLLFMPECSPREFTPSRFWLSNEEDGDPYKMGYDVQFECPGEISDPAFTVDGMPVP